MKTIPCIIKNSALLLLLAGTANTAWAQIKVENSEPEVDEIHHVYCTDGSSNLDYNSLGSDCYNEEMQLDYCKAFIGQKIFCRVHGDVLHTTWQAKEIEGGEFLLDFPIDKKEIGHYPIHKIATCHIGQPYISKTKEEARDKNGLSWVWDWYDNLYDKNGEYVANPQGRSNTLSCFTVTETGDELNKFFNQFLLIKGAYTIEEANRLLQASKEKILEGKQYLPFIQKRIDKLEQKKQKGKLKPEERNELNKYTNPSEREILAVQFKPEKGKNFYKIQFRGKEYFSQRLKGDTLIGVYDIELERDYSRIYHNICLLVEDNQGQEYFITFEDGSGCITEKHLAYVKEQYVSQYVTKTYNGKVTYSNGERVGPTMKCEDIVLRDHKLQAKLRDIQTDEIAYVPLSYNSRKGSSTFFLENYEIVVPENF